MVGATCHVSDRWVENGDSLVHRPVLGGGMVTDPQVIASNQISGHSLVFLPDPVGEDPPPPPGIQTPWGPRELTACQTQGTQWPSVPQARQLIEIHSNQ